MSYTLNGFRIIFLLRDSATQEYFNNYYAVAPRARQVPNPFSEEGWQALPHFLLNIAQITYFKMMIKLLENKEQGL